MANTDARLHNLRDIRWFVGIGYVGRPDHLVRGNDLHNIVRWLFGPSVLRRRAHALVQQDQASLLERNRALGRKR